MNHEHRVRAFLDDADPSWVNQKDRGWHFDNPESGDRYFEQQREREVAFSPGVERQTAVWDKPRLTPEQRLAKRMIEIEQARYLSFPHLPGLDLEELLAKAQARSTRKEPTRVARDYKALAAVLQAILHDLKPVAAERRIAELLGVKQATVHTHLIRWREEAGSAWTTEATEVQIMGDNGYVVVPLHRGSSSEKQPRG